MAIPFTPQDVASGFNLTKLNQNFDDTQTALQDALSRSGQGPNQMEADIDLNSNDLLNVNQTKTNELFINGALVTPDALQTIPASVMLKATYDPQDIEADVFSRDNHTGPVVWPVDTRTVLKALNTSAFTTAYLKEAGREGIFKWTTGDYSTQVAADTQEGVYVKADNIASTVGAWVRVGDPTVYHFGGSASADSSTAISVMEDVLGYVRFPAGATKVGANVTITVPLYFEVAAYVTVDATFTLTISNSIESPRQWIFRGDGSYSLTQDTTADVGESAREVHVSWFGAFPNPDPGTDQAPFINKAFSSMGNGRESIVYFDIGNYNISSQITVTRGGHVKGDGTRRTVFKLDDDGYDVFVTNNVACKFSDIQFELHSGLATRANAWISIGHADCEVYNVNIGQTDLGIVVTAGNHCRIWNIKTVYGADKASGSSAIKITGGGLHSVKGVYATSSSAFGPDYLIDVSAATSISSIDIEDIQTLNPAIPVRIRASAANISQVNVRNILYTGFAGGAPTAIVHILSESTFGVSNVSINGLVSNSFPSAAVRIESTSSGTTENIVIDNVVLPGSTGSGIEFVETSGTLKDIVIGGAVDVAERTTPYSYTGTPTGIRISPTALKDALPVASYDFTIADDGVASIDLQRSVFACWLMVAVGNSERAIYTCRAASTPTVTAYGTPSANMNTATTALTGTTGTDGRFTTGVTAGILYFENRLGSSARVNVTLMAPNA